MDWPPWVQFYALLCPRLYYSIIGLSLVPMVNIIAFIPIIQIKLWLNYCPLPPHTIPCPLSIPTVCKNNHKHNGFSLFSSQSSVFFSFYEGKNNSLNTALFTIRCRYSEYSIRNTGNIEILKYYETGSNLNYIPWQYFFLKKWLIIYLV